MEVGDLIATPLKIYDQICHANADKSFHDEVQKVVNDYSSKVPLYGCTTLDRIPDGHLVRIIGMVQDMFNSELYMDTYRLSANDETIRSFRYRDYSDFQNNEDMNPIDVKFSERQSFYIVPVPGESPWVRQARVKANEFTLPVPLSGQKRHLNQPAEVIHKKSKSIVATESAPNQVKYSKHFPLIEEEKNEEKSGALLRVYDGAQSQFKINDIVEIYGILEHARLCAALPEDCCEPEEKCQEPLPRIHAVIVKQLMHNNPLICEISAPLLSSQCGEIQMIRAKLINCLTTLFYGDEIVAEYVLLHLVSTRLSTDSPYPCHLPAINIHCGNRIASIPNSTDNSYDINKQSLLKLYGHMHRFLPQLVTHLATVELTVKSLNDGPCLMPIRDMAKGHLNPGRLQLPKGTEILVNEIEMDSGQLQPKGLLNFQALSSVAIHQRLSYDFQFYTQEWDTDVRVLILSLVPSLIKSVLSLPWQPQTLNADDNICLLETNISESEWNDMRKYLTILACSNITYSMDAELQERINQDFVQWRRDKSTFIESDEFAVMLCLLRFYCLTYGHQSPTVEHWLHIVDLEKKRKSRNAVASGK